MSKLALRDHVADRMDNVINLALVRNNVATSSNVFLTNHITECDRRIMYRVYGEETSKPKDIEEEFVRGAVINAWISLINEKSSIKVLDSVCILGDARYSISGKADAIVSFQGVPSALRLVPIYDEIEVIKEKGARRKDTVDLMLLSWIAEISHGFLIYVDVCVGTHCTFHVVPIRPVIKSACIKCHRLNDIRLGGGLPNRVYETKDSKECQLCEYYEICWQ